MGHSQTPLETLDHMYVKQPMCFKPLADEALKLVKDLQKKSKSSQWAGILPEKLFSKTFVKQLNIIDSLENLIFLHTSRNHLPDDIVKILKCIGSVDATPIDKIYQLTNNCADCCYTTFIETLIHLIHSNQSDRQTVLALILKMVISYKIVMLFFLKYLVLYFHNKFLYLILRCTVLNHG